MVGCRRCRHSKLRIERRRMPRSWERHCHSNQGLQQQRFDPYVLNRAAWLGPSNHPQSWDGRDLGEQVPRSCPQLFARGASSFETGSLDWASAACSIPWPLSPHTPNLQIRLERISKLVGAPYEQSDYATALKELRPLTRLRIFQQPAKLTRGISGRRDSERQIARLAGLEF